jgi:putative ABC transport system permease protein
VPLTYRNVLADRRRLTASVLGVGLAVMLILLLDGMWAGIQRQTTVYTDRAGADLYVLQPGVRDLTAGASTLPLQTLPAVRADPGVKWAAPVRTAYVILQLHNKKVAVYVVGSVPGEKGGAWSLNTGRPPRTNNEIVVGRVVARRHGIRVGDQMDVTGQRLRVVGISNSTGFMIDYVFMSHAALDRLSGTPNVTSSILIGTSAPSATAARLRTRGLNVLTRDQVAANDRKFATGIFGSPIRLMVAIGLFTGTLIIALTA